MNIKIKIVNLDEIKSAFAAAPQDMTNELNIAIRKSIMLLRADSVRNAPAVTGRLRSSAYTSFGPLRGEVGFNANYAVIVHEGSSAHIIEPKTKQALFWKGASHPVKLVHHPGTRANPFLQKAVDNDDQEIQGYFGKAVQNTFDKIAKAAG